jgi:hypothetical protein
MIVSLKEAGLANKFLYDLFEMGNLANDVEGIFMEMRKIKTGYI